MSYYNYTQITTLRQQTTGASAIAGIRTRAGCKPTGCASHPSAARFSVRLYFFFPSERTPGQEGIEEHDGTGGARRPARAQQRSLSRPRGMDTNATQAQIWAAMPWSAPHDHDSVSPRWTCPTLPPSVPPCVGFSRLGEYDSCLPDGAPACTGRNVIVA